MAERFRYILQTDFGCHFMVVAGAVFDRGELINR